VPRVGVQRDRDAEPGVGGHVLHRIGPTGGKPWRGQAKCVEVVHPLGVDEVARRVREHSATLDDAAVRAGLDLEHHHQTGLLLQRHPADQVVNPRRGRQSRVLIRLHRAVTVEVAEGNAVGGNKAAVHQRSALTISVRTLSARP
jgi:hypothetical protein